MPQHAVAIMLGSLLAYYGNELPDRYWSAYAPILLLLCRYNPPYRLLLLAGAAYLWSSALLHYHLDHRLIEAFDQRFTRLQAVVADIPEVDAGRVRLDLNHPEIDNYPGQLPRRLRLNWYQDEVIPQAGERWQFVVKLRQPRGSLNPDSFDFEAWQFSRGIDARGYIRNSTLNARLEPASPWQINFWRMRLASAIDVGCGACSHKGLIKALALGFRGDITPADKNLLQSSGTAHLLAISGLHVGLVAWLMYGVGRCCWRLGLHPGRLNRIQTAAVMAILGASLYAALAGFSLPTVRALVMLVILLLAMLLGNRVNLLQSLSLAVATILLVDPRAVGSNSFWLSLSALLVIAFVQFRLPERISWWRQLIALQCCFSLAMLPLGLLIFEQINPAGLPANLVAIPVISFIVLPAILCASLLALGGLEFAGSLFWLADRVLQTLLEYLGFLLSSGMSPMVGVYPLTLLLLILAAIVWLLLPRGLGLGAVTLVGLSLMLGWQPARPEQGAFEMLVFDVGIGTSILLTTRHHSLVYDFGPGKAGVFSATNWGLLPSLRKRGIERPDLAIVSHVDQDHSGGLHAFLDDHRQLFLLSGTPRELESRITDRHRVRSCHQFPDWTWDGVKFRFLPGSSDYGDTNNRSCVLMIQGNHRVLLAGDIEAAREQRLIARYGPALAADVLLAPHHGSLTSSSAGFVSQVKPRHVIYTLSRGNRWGFPAPAVVARYAALGSRQFRNDFDGAITVDSGAEGLSIVAERNPESRIWRRW